MKKNEYQRIHTTVPVDMIAFYPNANYSTLARDIVRRYFSYIRKRKHMINPEVIDKLIEYHKKVNNHFTDVTMVSDYLKYRHNLNLTEEEVLVNMAYAEMIIYGDESMNKDEILRDILTIS